MNDIRYIVNVEGAIYKGDKWLIIQRGLNEIHAPGLLSLVGGKVEDIRTSQDLLEKTLIREVYEEVGIEIGPPIYLESKSFKTDQGKLVVDIVMMCEHKSGVAFPLSTQEVERVLWMTTHEVLLSSEAPEYLKTTILHADQFKEFLTKRTPKNNR